MIAIVNVNTKWGIGKNGKLLCDLPEDMKFFRETTKDSVLIYGLNTLLSFPNCKPLKGRINIVVAKDFKGLPKYEKPDFLTFCITKDRVLYPDDFRFYVESRYMPNTMLLIVGSLDEIPKALEWIKSYKDYNVYVCGGASIYKQLLDSCDEALVTKNNCEEEADTFFPNLDVADKWRLESWTEEMTSVNGLKYRFQKYVKKK